MNNTELVARVSQISGHSREVCQKVLDAFEQAMSEGFSEKSWKTKALVSVSRVLNNIREKQQARTNEENAQNQENEK